MPVPSAAPRSVTDPDPSSSQVTISDESQPRAHTLTVEVSTSSSTSAGIETAESVARSVVKSSYTRTTPDESTVARTETLALPSSWMTAISASPLETSTTP